MKKIALTMIALLTMTVAVAQDNENGERKAPRQMTPEMMTERMAKDLSLTDAQKTKVLALNKEYQEIFKGPRMGRPRPPKPQADAETAATQQQRPQRPERPQLTDEQKAQMKAIWRSVMSITRNSRRFSRTSRTRSMRRCTSIMVVTDIMDI
jgi:Spy/CpxP family protein refolding chaperone